MKFADIDFGSVDASNDTRLGQYFIRIPEYEQVRSGLASFVIGRKGTGKTAICKMILDEAESSPTVFAVLLSLKNSPTSELYYSADSLFKAPNQYISIWRFLIALETAKLLLQDESVRPASRRALEQFLQQNFGSTDIACLDAVSTLRQNSWRIGLPLPIHALPAAELGRESHVASAQRLHYGRAAVALLREICAIESENEFFLLFDGLDEDYVRSPQYFDLIVSLLKAVYQIPQEMPKQLRLRPIVVLREDIYSQLDDHDLNKMQEVTVKLRWQSGTSRHREFSLRDLVNERIRSSLEVAGGEDLWPEAVDEAGWTGPKPSAWTFLMNSTMNRPRDIVMALNSCKRFETGDRLTTSSIMAARKGYSEWLSNEIGNEIYRLLPEYRNAFSVLARIGVNEFTEVAWREEFEKDETLASKYQPEAVLQMLFDFGVVGMNSRDRLVFKYKSPQIGFDATASFRLHRGLHRHLALRSRGV